jgi:two-component system NtrC family response regulator
MAVADHESALFLKHLPTHIRVKIAQNSIDKETHRANSEGEADAPAYPCLQALREAAIDRVEREYLQDLMSAAGANITEACRLSGLSRSRLYELLKKYGNSSPVR